MSMDGAQGALRACANLKQARPYLRCILSVGGAQGSKENFIATASDPQKRATFGYTSRQLVDQYNFDGIDGAPCFDRVS
jgi:chitinase